jgi:fructose-1,6-bisphosphatase II
MTDMTATTVLGAEHFDPSLVAHLRAATEAAAAASRPWFGKGDKFAADAAAVAAMREVLRSAPFDGRVVIGEGEKDDAPMLANGELLGAGGPSVDIAVDPLDGTRLVAEGMPGSVCVIAVAPRGTMFDPVDTFYMEKLIARVPLDLCDPVEDNLASLASSQAKRVTDLTVSILDKPRHRDLIQRARAAGATVRLVPEGDVTNGIAAATPGSGIDLSIGIGGTPEGVITACAVRALGGFMQARLAPQSADELAAAKRAGHDLARILNLDDLVRSDRTLYVATEV